MKHLVRDCVRREIWTRDLSSAKQECNPLYRNLVNVKILLSNDTFLSYALHKSHKGVSVSCYFMLCIFKKIPRFLQKIEFAVPIGVASVVSVEAQGKNLIRAGSIPDTSEKRKHFRRSIEILAYKRIIMIHIVTSFISSYVYPQLFIDTHIIIAIIIIIIICSSSNKSSSSSRSSSSCCWCCR